MTLVHTEPPESLALLRQQVMPFCGEGNSQSAIAGLSLYRSTITTAFEQAIYEPSLCVVLAGEKSAALGATSHVYREGQFLVVALDLPMACSILSASAERPYVGLSVRLDPEIIQEFVLGGPSFGEDVEDPSPVTTGTLTPGLLGALIRLTGLLRNPADAPFLAPLILRELHYHLVRDRGASLLEKIAQPNGQAARVGRAIAWIKQSYREPFCLKSAAAVANMSASSFHHHFKQITSMSPLQYQKQVRLHEARRLILSDNVEASTAGFEVGYNSPSQFSREYKRNFGAPPIRETLRLRELSASQMPGL